VNQFESISIYQNGETDAPAQATAVTLAAAAAPFKIDVAHHGLCRRYQNISQQRITSQYVV
jgi:hypothetical protein